MTEGSSAGSGGCPGAFASALLGRGRCRESAPKGECAILPHLAPLPGLLLLPHIQDAPCARLAAALNLLVWLPGRPQKNCCKEDSGSGPAWAVLTRTHRRTHRLSVGILGTQSPARLQDAEQRRPSGLRRPGLSPATTRHAGRQDPAAAVIRFAGVRGAQTIRRKASASRDNMASNSSWETCKIMYCHSKTVSRNRVLQIARRKDSENFCFKILRCKVCPCLCHLQSDCASAFTRPWSLLPSWMEI